ncbi:hypothetical protein BDZ89DRAFT_1060288 [Hymenopellis radicata]|nr:hypothetical protein BDZ89DRAFT_1060288 [Hymenopellis radicata]
MPTATSTTTIAGQSSSSYSTTLKATSAPSTASRLGTLIDGAGRAFVNRDYRLTQSLVESAFTLLHPPVSVPDALDDYRRRWDIFRITLEAHVYTSSAASDDLPPHLKDLLLQSSQALATAMYQRSLTLFTPANGSSKTPSTFNVIYIPPPVINTLVYATIKVNSPDVGRVIIEEWLARRDAYTSPTQSEAYKKLLAIYCLQILPALDQWDYAKEFLDYESELSRKSREYLRKSLQEAYDKAHTSRTPPSTSSTPSYGTPASPRSFSPAPSNSSSSSSLSTTSTHTVVPATPRGSHAPHSLASLSAASDSVESLSSNGTAKPRHSDGAATPERKQKSPARSATSHSTPNGTLMNRPHTVTPTNAVRTPGLIALIKASFGPIFNSSKMATFLIVAVVFPIVSMVNGGDTVNTADMVRKRLKAVNGAEAGVLGRVWSEVMRVVTDTIKMGGSGLV